MSVCAVVSRASGDISTTAVQDKIEALEAEWKKLPQVDIPVIHRFSGGIYAREITIPKDTFLTGRIYKEDHFDIMVSGDITVSSDDGIKRISGFNIFKGLRGKKRAGYAHEDTRWITFHSSKELADDSYLDAMTCESFAQLRKYIATSDYIDEREIVTAWNYMGVGSDYVGFRNGYLAAKGKKSKVEEDIADYNRVLIEYGFTEEIVREQSKFVDDQIDIDGDYGVAVRPSLIQGQGLYSAKSFKTGDVIMPARIDDKRTIAGRYINHSFAPNCIIKQNGANFDLIALSDLCEEEITTDYRTNLDLQIKAVE